MRRAGRPAGPAPARPQRGLWPWPRRSEAASLLAVERMAIEQTLLIIKPDAVARGAVGQIIGRLEAEGFALRQLRLVRLGRDEAERFYAVHRDRPFFAGLIQFMTSGPAIPMLLEREDAVAHLRRFIGVTDSARAGAGTIRGDFGTDVQRNAVHASDCPENAGREAVFFFGAQAG